jgi:uncharacterized metal-binding protein YceD (DUF177 family)
MAVQSFPWSAPFALADLPDKGAHVRIEASASECEAIAKLAGLRELSFLAADFHVIHASRGRVHVTGCVKARVGQECVVTLDPVENDIDEEVDVFFAPEDPAAPAAAPTSAADAAVEEPPEPIVGGRIDLGHLATEWLILGIDPYPRKADVAFEPVVAPNDPQDHPFAALAKLKDADSGKKPPKNREKPPRK